MELNYHTDYEFWNELRLSMLIISSQTNDSYLY